MLMDIQRIAGELLTAVQISSCLRLLYFSEAPLNLGEKKLIWLVRERSPHHSSISIYPSCVFFCHPFVLLLCVLYPSRVFLSFFPSQKRRSADRTAECCLLLLVPPLDTCTRSSTTSAQWSSSSSSCCCLVVASFKLGGYCYCQFRSFSFFLSLFFPCQLYQASPSLQN